MSRVAKNPVTYTASTTVSIDGDVLSVTGKKGRLSMRVSPLVELNLDANTISFSACAEDKQSKAMSGTVRALVQNLVHGVEQGFERKLELIGVGYRAKATGSQLNLTLGFSHPVDFSMPDGVSVETPSQTEIILKSADKQLLGEVAAKIRAYRPPEPYKGKGIRYSGEAVVRKEAKKK